MKVKLSDIKKELKDLSQKELITIISELYKNSKEVKEYFAVKYGGEEALEELFEAAAKKIMHEFFPSRGHGKLRFGVARKAIQDYKKITNDEDGTLALRIIYVEYGTEFTNTYGDIHEQFYDSMLSMFQTVVIECSSNEFLLNKYNDRLLEILDQSKDTGWGYHDCLCDIYYSHIEVDDEDE
ncbi:DUF6155 family protein [Sutcliffiella sp. NPDC057660]|uniref:DUF6155 family protein n=1 Tax=Sutcliffiella sp. NPDC057660 TaxID=3346199 RepID=UPI00368771EF